MDGITEVPSLDALPLHVMLLGVDASQVPEGSGVGLTGTARAFTDATLEVLVRCHQALDTTNSAPGEEPVAGG
jgi:hypothetical protein